MRTWPSIGILPCGCSLHVAQRKAKACRAQTDVQTPRQPPRVHRSSATTPQQFPRTIKSLNRLAPDRRLQLARPRTRKQHLDNKQRPTSASALLPRSLRLAQEQPRALASRGPRDGRRVTSRACRAVRTVRQAILNTDWELMSSRANFCWGENKPAFGTTRKDGCQVCEIYRYLISMQCDDSQRLALPHMASSSATAYGLPIRV